MKFIVRRTEVVTSHIVIDGAKNEDDANNIFDSILENREPIEFEDEQILTTEYEILNEDESQIYL
tara:strand:+ start:324 stop:518 length:195 start_codon:yes stop_codon:yes gene_type:complete